MKIKKSKILKIRFKQLENCIENWLMNNENWLNNHQLVEKYHKKYYKEVEEINILSVSKSKGETLLLISLIYEEEIQDFTLGTTH